MICAGPVQLKLSEDCITQINESVQTVSDVVEQGRVIYGINTGFGLLANTVIPREELEHLQHSIVLSHAVGVGKPYDIPTVLGAHLCKECLGCR